MLHEVQRNHEARAEHGPGGKGRDPPGVRLPAKVESHAEQREDVRQAQVEARRQKCLEPVRSPLEVDRNELQTFGHSVAALVEPPRLPPLRPGLVDLKYPDRWFAALHVLREGVEPNALEHELGGSSSRSARYAIWLDDIFTGLGLARAALVGTSLGGWLALDHAMRRPSRASALALICPAGIGRQKNFLLVVAPYLLLGGWGKRKIVEKVFGPAPKHLPVDLEALSPLMEGISRAIKPRAIKIPQLSNAALEALAMPLLVIVGGRDALIDSYDTRLRLEQHVPSAEVCFIEEGYHFLPDQSQRVFDFLVRSLRGYDPHASK